MMKQPIFDKAVMRLSIIYAIILTVICVGFSTAFWVSTNRELDQPFTPRAEVVREYTVAGGDLDITVVMQQRDDDMRGRLLTNLLFINACVIASGAIASYFLARRTMDPIRKMTEKQANFVSDASHELRTPLAAIIMENEVALRNKSLSKKETALLLESNLEEAKKLQELADRLLKLSQDEPFEITTVNVQHPIKAAIKRMQPLAGDKNIMIEDKSKQHKLEANKEALADIMVILIENAVKYSPPGSIVKVGNDGDKIYVEDNGEGIAEEDLPHIFDRFYRAEKSRTSNGYGLGLSLAKQLAGKMKMNITVESNHGKGVTFYLGK